MSAAGRRWTFIKWLDVYTKSADELTVRTTAGALVTFLATLLLVILVWNEVTMFMVPDTIDAVILDDRSREHMRITVDIEFHGLPCNKANFDLIDDSGDSSVQFVPKFSLRKDPTSQPKIPLSYCGSCDPARSSSTHKPNLFMKNRKQCCNSCNELKQNLADRKMEVALAETSEQCLREKHNAAFANSGGCRVYGHIEAPKVKANLHIAAGTATMQPHGGHSHHIHSITHADLRTFDISHTIHELSFGPSIQRQSSPLRGATYTAPGPVQVLYMAQVVPTTYTSVHGFRTYTFQYSVSEHKRIIDPKGQIALPGLFIKYDVAPYRIAMNEEGRAIIPFLVRLCAVVGGIYTTAGLLYATIGSIFNNKKKQ